MQIMLQDRREQAKSELTAFTGADQSATVDSLCTGLATLRRLLITRLHNDVEAQFGMDTLRAPSTTSEAKREIGQASEEIEIYSLAVVLGEVAHRGYAKGDTAWFRDWLLRLRGGE